MSNLFQRFRDLLPADPTLIGTVLSVNADGTTTLTTPGGDAVRVRGQGVAVAAKAFYRSGQIQGEAPNLTDYVLDV